MSNKTYHLKLDNSATGDVLADEMLIGDTRAMESRAGDLWNKHACMSPGRGWRLRVREALPLSGRQRKPRFSRIIQEISG